MSGEGRGGAGAAAGAGDGGARRRSSRRGAVVIASRPRALRVIGIDPGTEAVGYAVLDRAAGGARLAEVGVIRTPPGAPIERRLALIYDRLCDTIRRTSPEEAAIELLVYGKSIRSALRSGEGRGVAILAAGACGIPVSEYSPTKVKKAATGSGGARKGQVQEMVRRILGLPGPPPQDAADAIAIALCHLHQVRFQRGGTR